MIRGAASLLLVCLSASAQPKPMSLAEFTAAAMNSWHEVRATQKDAEAAAAQLKLARTAWLPRADVYTQFNRATRNNILGLLLPQSVLPGISGPIVGDWDTRTVWGSAVGLMVSWEPFDFGRRQAELSVTEAAQKRAAAATLRTRLEVGAAAADAYLTLIAATQTLRAAQAQLERAKTVNGVIEALVKSELRPGADATRQQAEIAQAQSRVLEAELAVEAATVSLRKFVDAAVISENYLKPPAEVQDAAAENPYVAERRAIEQESAARELAIQKTYRPRISVQSGAYARGSGAEVSGATLGGVNGLAPNVPNWVAGFSVSFPALDIYANRARLEAQRHETEAARERTAQTEVLLRERVDRANLALLTARRLADQTPVVLRAAVDHERQASARYKAGLTDIIELSEAQRLLTQAEIDDAMARLNIWRATLALAAARGNLEPFLEIAK